MKEVIDHYDKLIDEGNDPTNDPEELRAYMDKWDGQRFIDCMNLDESRSVLEIGIGTGRLAIKVAPLCKSLTGIDISPKTVARAKENLSSCRNVEIICGDFMGYEFTRSFDVIYSSLTFFHIKDKESAIRKVASILNKGGIFLLSSDKNSHDYIDMGTRKIKIYPTTPDCILEAVLSANLTVTDCFETDHAYVFVCQKL